METVDITSRRDTRPVKKVPLVKDYDAVVEKGNTKNGHPIANQISRDHLRDIYEVSSHAIKVRILNHPKSRKDGEKSMQIVFAFDPNERKLAF